MMNDLENEPKTYDSPKRARSFFVGAAVSFILAYGVLVFSSFLLPERMAGLTIGNLLWGPVCPSLFLSLVGGIVGNIVSNLPQPIYAAFLGSILFAVVVGLLSPRIILQYYHVSTQMLYFAIACTAMGAVVGGTVAIANRDRIDSGEVGKWPRFTLGEMLVGFFLMSVVFACLTAMVRNPH
jgi:hypothetical protein